MIRPNVRICSAFVLAATVLVAVPGAARAQCCFGWFRGLFGGRQTYRPVVATAVAYPATTFYTPATTTYYAPTTTYYATYPSTAVAYYPSYSSTVAYYAPSTYVAPAVTTAYYTPSTQVCQYVPETTYRDEYVSVPVTTLRPAVGVDACTGCPVTTYYPATTYTQQVRRVPVTTYRQVCTPVTAACYAPAIACCPTTCVPCQPAATSQAPASRATDSSQTTFRGDANNGASSGNEKPTPAGGSQAGTGDEGAGGAGGGTGANPTGTRPRDYPSLLDPQNRMAWRRASAGIQLVSRRETRGASTETEDLGTPSHAESGWRASSR